MSAPKPPKLKEINPYAGVSSDPRINKARQALGMDSIENDDDMRAIYTYLNQQEFELERNNPTFQQAERQLMEEGLLAGGSDKWFDIKNKDLNNKQQRLKNKYLAENGADADWRYGLSLNSRSYTDQQDLQRVYDRVFEIESETAQADADLTIKKQTKAFEKSQKQAQRKNTRAMNKMNRQNIKAQERAQEFQRQMMEDMMNQPVFSAKQAALPTVQAKPKLPDPMPVAPAPPPQMNIATTPAPELVNIGNPMGIVRQSQTARSRSRQRTKGTSSLT